MNHLTRSLFSFLTVAAIVPVWGCYFGRSSTAKQGAYVANGMLVAAAAAVYVSAWLGDDSEVDCPDVSCAASAAGEGYATLAVVGVLGSIGLAGIGVNLLVPTTADTATTTGTAVPDSSSYVVTAPGLAPAVVKLR